VREGHSKRADSRPRASRSWAPERKARWVSKSQEIHNSLERNSEKPWLFCVMSLTLARRLTPPLARNSAKTWEYLSPSALTKALSTVRICGCGTALLPPSFEASIASRPRRKRRPIMAP